MKIFSFILLLSLLLSVFIVESNAQTAQGEVPDISEFETEVSTVSGEATSSSMIIENKEVVPTSKPDLTQESKETVEPLKRLLQDQELGSIFPYNPLKYAIRESIDAGVPPNTVVLLLLLPGVAALIAGARHLIGLRGFGIFLPAALSVVFIATGPIVGIALFLVIVTISTIMRIGLRKMRVKLQYLPRMALMLLFVVLGILGVLFLAPIIGRSDFANVSIFPVLILVLLSEDFTRVQLGKNARVAVNLAGETLILALGSFVFLSLKFIQEFALLNPEIWIVIIIVVDILLGKYVGLRFIEYWRFRKLLTN